MAKSKKVTTSKQNPAEVVLVIDVSGSMDGSVTIGNQSYRKLEYAENAAASFVSLMRLKTDSLGVCSFNTKGEYEWGKQNGTQYKVRELTDLDVRNAAISSILDLDADGNTDMYKGLEYAGNMFTDLQTDKKAIVLLSDGHDNHDVPGEEEEDLARELNTHGKSIYTVAVGDEADQKKLAAIAGKASRAIDVADAFELNKAFNDIIDQIGIAQVLVNEIVSIPGSSHTASVHPLKDNTVPAGVDTVRLAIVWDNFKTYSWAGLDAPLPTGGKLVFSVFSTDENDHEVKVENNRITVVKDEPGVLVLDVAGAKAGEHYGCQMFTSFRDNDKVRFSVGVFTA